MLGQKVMERTNAYGNTTTLNISDFSNGLCLVEISSKGCNARIKILKNN